MTMIAARKGELLPLLRLSPSLYLSLASTLASHDTWNSSRYAREPKLTQRLSLSQNRLHRNALPKRFQYDDGTATLGSDTTSASSRSANVRRNVFASESDERRRLQSLGLLWSFRSDVSRLASSIPSDFTCRRTLC